MSRTWDVRCVTFNTVGLIFVLVFNTNNKKKMKKKEWTQWTFNQKELAFSLALIFSSFSIWSKHGVASVLDLQHDIIWLLCALRRWVKSIMCFIVHTVSTENFDNFTQGPEEACTPYTKYRGPGLRGARRAFQFLQRWKGKRKKRKDKGKKKKEKKKNNAPEGMICKTGLWANDTKAGNSFQNTETFFYFCYRSKYKVQHLDFLL